MSMHWACYGTGVAHDERLGCRHADHGPCGGKCPRCDDCDGSGKIELLQDVRYALVGASRLRAGSTTPARIESVTVDPDGTLRITVAVDDLTSPRERSTMRIVKMGIPPGEVELQVECATCHSVLEFRSCEIRTVRESIGDPGSRYVSCPVCEHDIPADRAKKAQR